MRDNRCSTCGRSFKEGDFIKVVSDEYELHYIHLDTRTVTVGCPHIPKSETEGYSPYLTMIELGRWFHINRMDWSKTADDYQVTETKKSNARDNAFRIMSDWAESDGLEVR